jgi:hypothetical protein
MRRIVKGSDGFGNDREYDLVILSAVQGLKLVHTYGSILINALPQITALFTAWGRSEDADETKLFSLAATDFQKGEGPLLDCIRLLPQIVSTDRLLYLAKLFLGNAKVNGQECDDDGMCELFTGRPHEVYAAILFAVLANFKDYLPFLDSDDITDSK